LVRYLMAVALGAAFLGPWPAPRPPVPIPIVAVAPPRREGELVRRRRGGREETWLIGLPLEVRQPPSPN
jgi:hypothetical protein